MGDAGCTEIVIAYINVSAVPRRNVQPKAAAHPHRGVPRLGWVCDGVGLATAVQEQLEQAVDDAGARKPRPGSDDRVRSLRRVQRLQQAMSAARISGSYVLLELAKTNPSLATSEEAAKHNVETYELLHWTECARYRLCVISRHGLTFMFAHPSYLSVS